jgi:hypothetical protein
MTLFSEFIAEHCSGVADADLTDALREILEAVALTDKAGSLTLTVNVSKEGDMFAITHKIGQKIPSDTTARFYWLDLEGNLTRNNPLQPALPFNPDKEDH